jgi:hypothetical protein
MSRDTYLVLIKEGRLALTVAAALEERLAQDGHKALALVPAVRDLGLTAGACPPPGRARPEWLADFGRSPVVVALSEEGLLPRLEALGLAAYVGVPREEDWRVVRWGDDGGAIMLPVATARDLVAAIADHTPWQVHAAEPPAAEGRVMSLRHPASLLPTPQALLSGGLVRVGAAGMAGSLLLLGMPAHAADAVAGREVTRAPVTSATLDAYQAPAMPIPPVPGRNIQNGVNVIGQAGQAIANFFNEGFTAEGNAEQVNGQAQIDQGQAIDNGIASAATNVWNAILQANATEGQAGLDNGKAQYAAGKAVDYQIAARVPYGDQGVTTGEEYGSKYGVIVGGVLGTIGGAVGGGVLAAALTAGGGTPAGGIIGGIAGLALGAGLGDEGGKAVGGLIGFPVGYFAAPVPAIWAPGGGGPGNSSGASTTSHGGQSPSKAGDAIILHPGGGGSSGGPTSSSGGFSSSSG